jgi:hypothetical protein
MGQGERSEPGRHPACLWTDFGRAFLFNTSVYLNRYAHACLFYFLIGKRARNGSPCERLPNTISITKKEIDDGTKNRTFTTLCADQTGH